MEGVLHSLFIKFPTLHNKIGPKELTFGRKLGQGIEKERESLTME
jgi:hypothetical protein